MVVFTFFDRSVCNGADKGDIKQHRPNVLATDYVYIQRGNTSLVTGVDTSSLT